MNVYIAKNRFYELSVNLNMLVATRLPPVVLIIFMGLSISDDNVSYLQQWIIEHLETGKLFALANQF